jgi:hypothetical protein
MLRALMSIPTCSRPTKLDVVYSPTSSTSAFLTCPRILTTFLGAQHELGLGQILRDRLGRGEMQPDTATLVVLLVEGDSRLIAVLVEVFDSEPTDRNDAAPV